MSPVIAAANWRCRFFVTQNKAGIEKFNSGMNKLVLKRHMFDAMCDLNDCSIALFLAALVVMHSRILDFYACLWAQQGR